MAKRSSDPGQAYPAVKLQGRDLVRVVGIVAPFAPLGVGTRGKFVLSNPRWEMGTGHLCRVPLATVRHGRARKISGTTPCGDCKRVLWVPGPRGQYLGKNRFIEKLVTRRGGRHVAIVAIVVCILVPFTTPGKIRFIEPQAEMCTGDLCLVPLAAVRQSNQERERGGA